MHDLERPQQNRPSVYLHRFTYLFGFALYWFALDSRIIIYCFLVFGGVVIIVKHFTSLARSLLLMTTIDFAGWTTRRLRIAYRCRNFSVFFFFDRFQWSTDQLVFRRVPRLGRFFSEFDHQCVCLSSTQRNELQRIGALVKPAADKRTTASSAKLNYDSDF